MRGQRTKNRGVGGAAKVVAVGLVVVLGSVACERGDAAQHRGQPDAGRPPHAPANFDPSIPGFVACSTTILEGHVVRVVDGSPGHMLVTLTVDHWVKPSSGPARVELSLVDIAKDGVYKRWSPGTHLRLAVNVDRDMLPQWQFSADQLTAFEKALPRANRLSCPYGPR